MNYVVWQCFKSLSINKKINQLKYYAHGERERERERGDEAWRNK